MKVLLAQINTTAGALEANARRIEAALDEGRRRGADLVLLPELAVTGYPPKDLLDQPSFVARNLETLERLAGATRGIGAVMGYVDRNPSTAGRGLFNAAALFEDGKIVSRHYKCLLPTYDVFDEDRYFDAGGAPKVAQFRGKRLGISICEDIWNDREYWSQRRYASDPIEALAGQGCDFLINIAASPFTMGKRETRLDLLANAARRHGRMLFHLNLVGGNDGLIFDGWSNVFGPDGSVLAQLRDFEESYLLFDTEEAGRSEIQPTQPGPLERVKAALLLGLRDYVRKCGFKRVVVGLSGGIDSALTAALAAEALGPEAVMGVAMPSRYSSQGSFDDARALAKTLGIKLTEISIEKAFGAFLETLGPIFAGRQPDVTEENIQSRVRGILLMAISNKFGALVLSTGNKSELAMGYCTLYGDMAGGLAVISDVPKTMVYELAALVNREREIIPRSSIEKAPSAELKPDQKDTDSLPPYEALDEIIRGYVEEHLSVEEIVERWEGAKGAKGVKGAEGEKGAKGRLDRELVAQVVRTIDRMEYKRQQAPPGLKVTSKAFGYGRRMPIARGEL